MTLYLVEEAAIKEALDLSPGDPIWRLFDDGPIQRMEGQAVDVCGNPAVVFRRGRLNYVLPADVVTEID